MPYGDGTGPMWTGRSVGVRGMCIVGRGLGRGGRAVCGFGGGLKFVQAAPLMEKEALQQEAQALEARLAAIKKRNEEIK